MDSALQDQLLQADLGNLFRNAGWLAAHREQARLAVILFEYLSWKAMSICVSQPVCDRCERYLGAIGVHPGHVSASSVCHTAMGCAYTEALHNPVQTMNMLQEIISDISALSKLPQAMDEQHRDLLRHITEHPADGAKELMRAAGDIYGKQSPWLKLGLPQVLVEVCQEPKRITQELLTQFYDKCRTFGRQHVETASSMAAAAPPPPAAVKPKTL